MQRVCIGETLVDMVVESTSYVWEYYLDDYTSFFSRAIGIILYVMLMGRSPFKGSDEMVMKQIKDPKYPTPSNFGPWFDIF